MGSSHAVSLCPCTCAAVSSPELVHSWRPGCIALGPLITRKVWDNPVCFSPKSGVWQKERAAESPHCTDCGIYGGNDTPVSSSAHKLGLGCISGLGQVSSRRHGGIWQRTKVWATKNNSIAGVQQNNFPDGAISFLLDVLDLSSPSRVLLSPLYLSFP